MCVCETQEGLELEAQPKGQNMSLSSGMPAGSKISSVRTALAVPLGKWPRLQLRTMLCVQRAHLSADLSAVY